MVEARRENNQERLERDLRDRLAMAFELAGWRVARQPAGRLPAADFLCRGEGVVYAVELRALDAAARLSRLQALLADAILRARAIARRCDALPLAVVAAEQLSDRMLSGLADYARQFAEGIAWGAMDRRGRLDLFGPGLEGVRGADLEERKAGDSMRRIAAADPFSDLGQWVIKVLLSPRVPGGWLEAPRGPLRNVGQLAKEARISAASASRLLAALRDRGFVDESPSTLRLVRLPALLRSWRAVALKPSLEVPARFLFPAADPMARLEKLVAERVNCERAHQRVCLGLFAACKVLGVGWVRGAPLHLYSEDLSPDFLGELGLHPAGSDEDADLVVRKPRFPESLFRGAVSVDGVPVADVLQCWLDVGAHPVRGAEQAREVLDRLGLSEG